MVMQTLIRARYNGTDLTGALNEDPIKDQKKRWKRHKMVSKEI